MKENLMDHSTALPSGWDKSPLAQELETFLTHQPEWLRTDPGKYALIKGDSVVGLYDQQEDAFAEGYKRFQREAFMVQRIQESLDTYYFGGSGVGVAVRIMSYRTRLFGLRPQTPPSAASE